MNLKKHIAYISGKVSRGIGVILKARKLLPLSTLKTLYFSFIYPFFTYCNQVWGSACDTHLYRLVLLQKRCIRIITRSKYREHTDPLFDKLGLLKMDQVNKYFIYKFMYKWYHDKLPSLFQSMFTPVRDIHDHGTRQLGELYCPKVRTEYAKLRISYQAPMLWNKMLKARIDPECSEAVFCKSIKQCLKVGLL